MPFVPLLLVQVDSKADSVASARDWLIELGMPADAIRVHTADEPNPSLLADAHDEEAQALIFKTAVATGFDAPRAFVLASLRNAQDVDFGVQVIGRILRVDRRLQVLPALPDALENAYVVLANADGQKGLNGASDRINAIKDHLDLRPTVVVLPTGEDGTVVTVDTTGRTHLFDPTSPDAATISSANGPGGIASVQNASLTAGTLFGVGELRSYPAIGAGTSPPAATRNWLATGTIVVRAPYAYRYPRRPGVPERLETARVTRNQQTLRDDVVDAYPFEELLHDTRRAHTQMVLRVEEVFTRTLIERRDTQATLSERDIDRVAQQHLFNVNRDGALDPLLLSDALQAGLQRVLRRRGWTEADDTAEVRRGLQKLLALHPARLEEAIRRAVAKHTEAHPTESPLPQELLSTEQLPPEANGSYGVLPPDLNRWEQAFVREVERDADTRIGWWHRNPVRKPYSVAVPIPGQPNFYPDFALQVPGREHGNGIVLVEIKGEFNDHRGNAQEKAQATHPTYGNVLMLHWHREEEWRHVTYNATKDRNELAGPFYPDQLRTYR